MNERLTTEQLRAWLDRKPPPKREPEPPEPSEFDAARAADPLMEAGHG